MTYARAKCNKESKETNATTQRNHNANQIREQIRPCEGPSISPGTAMDMRHIAQWCHSIVSSEDGRYLIFRTERCVMLTQPLGGSWVLYPRSFISARYLCRRDYVGIAQFPT